MQTITHEEQQERWNKEHEKPNVLLQMDSENASSGVVKFIKWLEKNDTDLNGLYGMEMCCGKGRNVIGLAKKGAVVTGLDFSPAAIKEATKRAMQAKVNDKTPESRISPQA